MSSNDRLTERNIDLVFCIDGTGSMSGCIDVIKENARSFRNELCQELIASNSTISSLRVRVIVFRDYGCDADAMEKDKGFFELPVDEAEFEDYLNRIEAHGGGDDNENGLEALYYAMKSDFFTNPKDRQIIVLFTDADALDLKERSDSPYYPADMVDMAGFENTWNCRVQDDSKLRNRNKRLVIFAPAETKYESISSTLDNVWFKAVEMREGLREINFDDIIRLIIASI